MNINEREEYIIKTMSEMLAKFDGKDPKELCLAINLKATSLHDSLKPVEIWETYRAEARRYRVASLAMARAEVGYWGDEHAADKAEQAEIATIKLVVGTDAEREEALAAFNALGRFPYIINHNMNEPRPGLPMTCACGRLNDDLTPETRFTALCLGTGKPSCYRLFCDRCIGLADFIGLGFANITKQRGGLELLRLCLKRGTMGEHGGTPAPDAETKAPADKAESAGLPQDVVELTKEPHAPDWQMQGGRELCRKCWNWRHSPEAEILHAGMESPLQAEQQGGSIPVENEENQAKKQGA